MEDMSKLPKWAQEKIKTLEMRVREGLDCIEQLQHPGPSRVCMPHHHFDGGKAVEHKLDEDQTYRFKFGQEHWNYIDIRLRKDFLEVMGGDGIQMHPSAANVVHVKIGRS